MNRSKIHSRLKRENANMQLTFRMQPSLYEFLQKQAEKHHTTTSKLIVAILSQYRDEELDSKKGAKYEQQSSS